MKNTVFTILFLSFGSLFAQTAAPGYYITQTNDTISADFKIQKGIFGQIRNDFTNEAIVIKNEEETLKFRPEDIKEYGFSLDGSSYKLFSKPVKKGGNKFLAPIFIGPKSSLYQYSISTSGSGTNLPSTQVFYTFEKADGSSLLLGTMGPKKFKEALKDFFKDSPHVQNLVDERFKDYLNRNQDLKDMMREANKV
jgi:hypothetical protein